MKKFLLFITLFIGVQQLSAQVTLAFSHTDVTCYGACNGTATVLPSGGSPPYTYAWNPPAFSQVVTGLCAGVYNVTVTDALGGTATGAVMITEPAQLVLSGTVTNVSCNAMCDGAIATSLTGGTAPFNCHWSNASSQLNQTNLCTGSYSCTITDSNGCTATGSYTVTQPVALNVTITPPNPSICAGGSVALNGMGAMAYTWMPTLLTGASIIVTPTTTTTYTLTGVDPNGCTGTTSTTVYVNQPPTVTTTAIEAGCNMADGSATAIPSGNPPFTYTWLPSGGTTQVATNLVSSTYTVFVTDVNGCSTSAPVIVNDSCDFVWPGDANDDAVADNLDILDIGIANGATGTTRANASLNWIGQPSAAWGTTLLSGTDYKWVDCNGDGTIDPTDTNAVVQNFGLVHNNRLGGTPVYDAMLPDLTVTMGQNILAANSAGTLSIAFGSSSVPVSSFYGLAFTLNFDATQIDASTFRMNENGTWMGIPGTDLMGVVMNNGNGTGSVQVAITRLNHVNSNGFGDIANVGFMTTGTMVATGNMQNVNFTISDVTVIDANETPQTVNPIGDSLYVADPVITGISANENIQAISAYPNPFDQSVQINLPAAVKGKICDVTLTDASGRVVLSQQTQNAGSVTIQRGNLDAGIYFCTVRSEGQVVGNTKVIVK